MNKIGKLLEELHDAETGLADEYRGVAERQSTDHGTHYPCHTLAAQCDQHAERIRAWAQRFGKDISAPKRSDALASAAGSLRHKASETFARRPESGLLLLRDLRQLYLKAEAVNIHWIMLAQVAQAVRDQELLEDVSGLHQQTLTQIKWLKTRVKDASPQILVVTD
ncbi:hypothetical protein ACFOSC_20485 [Streptantibioticus rubrisoli]|uniref:DUF2383 domain-containing protein n=1 Tax=Streptantibioticus rubrisoli TaxID=1387313 RepID=A0ABT1PJP8_9ACTN|nr:hypothetical protein [Streptantibioticus rubrisoli]MCQ4044733.1 hypothetical protein [Streptantibioticus rubrisoli]